jgi:hypothetical protein
VRKILLLVLNFLLFLSLCFSLPKIYAATSTLPPCAQWTDLNGKNISKQTAEKADKEKIKCAAVSSAIGNISTEPQAFVKTVFSIVLGLAGGIALILIIFSGYRFMTSGGNPEAVKGATEQLVSAIVGLLFIILSFVILQVIGVDILRIPGFSK